MPPDFLHEDEAGGLVAGVDEAGRGPLAGPVLAAAVIFLGCPSPALAALIDDSKKLNAQHRQAAHDALRAAAREGLLHFAIGAASVPEIGRLNILRATHLAMARAVARLAVVPGLVLVDGNQPPVLAVPLRCLVGGDALSLSIAAASILAKVTRDRCMARLHSRWPGYGFASHQGYPTLMHRTVLAEIGPCPHHRRGFAPVEAAYAAA